MMSRKAGTFLLFRPSDIVKASKEYFESGVMKMKKALSVLFAVILVSAAGLSLADAKHVRPLELSPDSYDLNNGEFWFEAEAPSGELAGGLLFIYLATTYLWSVLRTAPKSA